MTERSSGEKEKRRKGTSCCHYKHFMYNYRLSVICKQTGYAEQNI